jgi:hypothetical protein
MRIDFRFSYQVGKKIKAILQAVTLVALTSFGTSAYSASKTILVLGDSLSAEYGLIRGEGWVNLLQKKLESEKRPLSMQVSAAKPPSVAKRDCQHYLRNINQPSLSSN